MQGHILSFLVLQVQLTKQAKNFHKGRKIIGYVLRALLLFTVLHLILAYFSYPVCNTKHVFIQLL